MENIICKMITADTIILASPVYFNSINAQMKVFIDRMISRYTELVNKEFYFIITGADTDKNNLLKTVETLRRFTNDCLPNSRERGIIWGVNCWNKGDVKNTPAYEQTYEMGKLV